MKRYYAHTSKNNEFLRGFKTRQEAITDGFNFIKENKILCFQIQEKDITTDIVKTDRGVYMIGTVFSRKQALKELPDFQEYIDTCKKSKYFVQSSLVKIGTISNQYHSLNSLDKHDHVMDMNGNIIWPIPKVLLTDIIKELIFSFKKTK